MFSPPLSLYEKHTSYALTVRPSFAQHIHPHSTALADSFIFIFIRCSQWRWSTHLFVNSVHSLAVLMSWLRGEWAVSPPSPVIESHAPVHSNHHQTCLAPHWWTHHNTHWIVRRTLSSPPKAMSSTTGMPGVHSTNKSFGTTAEFYSAFHIAASTGCWKLLTRHARRLREVSAPIELAFFFLMSRG